MTSHNSSTADSSLPSPEVTTKRQSLNLWALMIAQALAGANSVIIFATGAIVGSQLAPSQLLVTLPISVFVVGMAAFTLPMGRLAGRFGRRPVFMIGTATGIMAGLLGMLAVQAHSFWLFCVACASGGAYAAVALSFRFSATDSVPSGMKARALSMVMAGGVAAGVIGPQTVNLTMDIWPSNYAATFLCQAMLAALAALVLLLVKSPAPVHSNSSPGRPLTLIIKQPRFVTAVIAGSVAYLLMNFLMTAAPLAMHQHGHSHHMANLGIQWHVIAMYAPSFFTGKLITRVGANKVTALGMALTGVAAFTGLLGTDVFHFWTMLILLGVGWNFAFVGASAIVLECHSPAEAAKVQSLNDFIVFGVMALGSFASGGILSQFGWHSVLKISGILLALSAYFLIMLHCNTQDSRAQNRFLNQGD